MEVITFVVCFFSVGLGFGLACVIFAILLSRSNDIGNSTGMVEDYKIDISFDVCKNHLEHHWEKQDEADLFIIKYTENIDSGIEEPDPDKVVEAMPLNRFELEDITAIYVDG